MAERKGGQGPREYPLSIGSVIWDKKFVLGRMQVGVTVPVLEGKMPARGVTFKFLIGGQQLTNEVVVDPAGQAKGTFLLDHKSLVAIELFRIRTQERMVIPLEEVSWPESKRKLEVLGSFIQEDRFDVYLRRVGKDGKPEAGRISYFDLKVEEGRPIKRTLFTEDMEAGKDAVGIHLSIFERGRTIEFFLPDDDQAENASVNVPGRIKEGKEAQFTLAEAVGGFAANFRKGKNLYKKHGSVISALASLGGEPSKGGK